MTLARRLAAIAVGFMLLVGFAPDARATCDVPGGAIAWRDQLNKDICDSLTNGISAPASTPILKSALSTTVSQVVGAAATLTSYYCFNPNTSVAYVQIHDIATAGGVTLGTTVPKWSIGIPASGGANLAGLALSFAAGIQVAATTTSGGSSAPSTALDCNFGYR
jgi:hypothetical protein